MFHMFDTEIAIRYGVNAAILFQNIAFWCSHSKANGTNYHDGLYWTYNSVKAFQELFPYLGKSQISSALQKLLDEGLIVKGNYNQIAYDRTTWYAVTEYGETLFRKPVNGDNENHNLHLSKIGNGDSKNRKPIPYINSNNKPNISIPRRSADKDNSIGFDDFWKLYPRKVAKSNAIKSWNKTGAPDSQALIDTILADVRRRLECEWKGKDIQYIPHPSTYLNQKRWEDEQSTLPKDDEYVPAYESMSVEEIIRRSMGD